MIFPVSKTVLSFTPKSSIRAIFRPKNYFVCFSKTMHWDTFVFSCFSLIFGCSLTVFSVHLDASPWNLEFFWFTRTSFFVHQKNSRFQGSASRFTEKTVSSQPKMQEKQKKTSGVSLHSFPGAYKIFFGRKMARKEQFQIKKMISWKLQFLVFMVIWYETYLKTRIFGSIGTEFLGKNWVFQKFGDLSFWKSGTEFFELYKKSLSYYA